jgi:aminoglycoside phosphotransferase (APT) family kinase protein
MVDDDFLPAASHLTSVRAFDVLAPAVARTGAELVGCEATQVQYRPGSDLIVRYRASVRTARGVVDDTLFAGVTASGPPTGALVVEASAESGSTVRVGVWRWPFDPVLPALEQAVTPHLVQQLLGPLAPARPAVEVVAFRPTERAVVRVSDRDGVRPVVYVKVVEPTLTERLVGRHHDLRRAGLPVPAVLVSGPGWFAMEALMGPTLRDHLKSGEGAWPAAFSFCSMLGDLNQVELSDPSPARSRNAEAPAHAAMLASILPGERHRLASIVDRLRALEPGSTRQLVTVHGDFHEAQIVLDGSQLSGLLDIDDLGLGDPVADASTLLAHLLYRARTTPVHGDRIRAYAGTLRRTFARVHGPGELDRMTAATLVGLATGPFRVRQAGWERVTREVLDEVERLLDRRPDRSRVRAEGRRRVHEGHLSTASRTPHSAPAP